MKNRILCLLAFMPIFFFGGCQDDSDGKPVSDLQGTWSDTVALTLANYTLQDLTFHDSQEFTSKTFYFRVTQNIPTVSSVLVAWDELSGDFLVEGDTVRFYAKKHSHQDVSTHGDIIAETIDRQLYEHCTYKLLNNGSTLELNYITYPADAPVETQATFTKKVI
jgi:hypothetical protein